MSDCELWEDEPGPWDDPSWWAPGEESDVDSDINFDVDGMDLDGPTADASKAMVVYQPQRVGPNDSNPLVKLPNELKMLITDHFTPGELVKLGTACRSLWPFCRDMALERALKRALRSPPASPEPVAAQPASLPAANNLLLGPPAPPPINNNNMALVPFNNNTQPGPGALNNNWHPLVPAPFFHQPQPAFPPWFNNNNPPVQVPWNINHPPGFQAAPVNMPAPFPGQTLHGQPLGFNPPPFHPPHLLLVPFMPPPPIPFPAFVPWQPPPLPFPHNPGNNAPAVLPRRPHDYVERILQTALKYRSTWLLSQVRDYCNRLDKKFEVDKPIVDTTSSPSNPTKKHTLLELVVKNHDQDMAEWLLVNGAKPDGKPFVFVPPTGITAADIIELVKTRQREQWKMNTPLCDLLFDSRVQGGHVCMVGLVKLLLRHGAKAVAPSHLLVALGECKVHAPESECQLEMAKAFLSRPDVDADDRAKARIINWMEKFMPDEKKRKREENEEAFERLSVAMQISGYTAQRRRYGELN